MVGTPSSPELEKELEKEMIFIMKWLLLVLSKLTDQDQDVP